MSFYLKPTHCMVHFWKKKKKKSSKMKRSIKSNFPSLLIIHASLPMYISMSYLKKKKILLISSIHHTSLTFSQQRLHIHTFTQFLQQKIAFLSSTSLCPTIFNIYSSFICLISKWHACIAIYQWMVNEDLKCFFFQHSQFILFPSCLHLQS